MGREREDEGTEGEEKDCKWQKARWRIEGKGEARKMDEEEMKERMRGGRRRKEEGGRDGGGRN
jgi:hypothetical protein